MLFQQQMNSAIYQSLNMNFQAFWFVKVVDIELALHN